MVHLGHMAGSQADLVAIGGIARRRGLGQLPLGQLALQGLVKGYPGVAAAGELVLTDRLVHLRQVHPLP